MNTEVQYWTNYLNSWIKLLKTYNFTGDKESLCSIRNQRFSVIFHIVNLLHPELQGNQLCSVVNTIEQAYHGEGNIVELINAKTEIIKSNNL